MKLAVQTVVSSVVGLALFGVLLFWPAGTFAYWQAWLFIAVFIVSTVVPSVLLAVRDPAALRRRMKSGPVAESRPVQKLVITGTFTLVFAVLVVSALDHRFGWSHVPTALVILGDVLVIAGLGVAQLVIVQNSYAAATITVEAGQKLATTGLYGVVRHPMYAGTLVMMVGMPLALDSYWGLLSLLPGGLLLAVRILDEERMLREQLDGYAEYMHTVRYRVVPYLW
jgi:protein-S-isoprenylcysteine O-methyltransferase Ste14